MNSLEKRAKILRKAARHVRSGDAFGSAVPHPVVVALCDWLNGEAAMLAQIEPLLGAINSLTTNLPGGGTVSLRLAENDDGDIQMQADSSDCAVRLAVELLACSARLPVGGDQ